MDRVDRAPTLRWTDGPVTALLLVAWASAIAFSPDLYPMMLARSFLWQWGLAAASVTVLAIATRRWWSAGAACASAILLLSRPLPTLQAVADAHGEDVISVAQMNILQPNTDHAGVIRAALGTNAEVISFQEVSAAWEEALIHGLGDCYPFHLIVPGTDPYGIALFSRLPFLREEVISLAGTPMLRVVVDTPGGRIRLLCVHATSPGSFAHFERRNRQLDRLPDLVNDEETPVVLLGDLNAVCWDRAYVDFCMRSGLREHHGGDMATWPVFAGMALIPLDHVLVSRDLSVLHLDRFTIPGSDHLGLMATIRANG